MADKFVSKRNLMFLLHEVFDVESLTRYPYYEAHSREVFDMALETALRIGEGLLKPTFQAMDKEPPEFVSGQIKAHPSVKAFMKEFGEGGWIGAGLPEDVGGLQLPRMITMVCRFVFSAANYSASVYPALTAGAARLIQSLGSNELIETYLPKMLAGEWQGTMALTEPQAGSSVGDITTRAEPADHGYYNIKGQKAFISAGDHDAAENIVHMMLARIKGAPPGVKGISLFLVPKKRIDEKGELVSNDVQVAGFYHKLGYRGTPITQLSLGEDNNCRGYLVGEPNRGLAHMFQMVNDSRLAVGISAAAIASAAYYAALEYSQERLQGRRLGARDPASPQIPIIEHPDVKRMLLFQRSVVEGCLSLLIQCCKYADLVSVLTGEEKEKNSLLLDLLTPVAKSYPSEMGIISVSQALQCLGGYGYCDEFPLEQLYRDTRIHPIHEGTTGIQGLDLLGRKVRMEDGRTFGLYLEEVQKTILAANDFEELKPYARELNDAIEKLKTITGFLMDVAKTGNLEVFLADATLYLELFGIITVAWQWLVQGIAIQRALKDCPSGEEPDFYRGKFFALQYFFKYELPKIEGLAKVLRNSNGLTAEIGPNLFFS